MATLSPRAAQMNHHEAAAADVAGARIGDRERKTDRDRGIDRIAAALEHVDADARRARLLRDDHAVGSSRCLRVRNAGVARALRPDRRSREDREQRKTIQTQTKHETLLTADPS